MIRSVTRSIRVNMWWSLTHQPQPSICQSFEDLGRSAFDDLEQAFLDILLEVGCRAMGVEGGLVGILLVEKEASGVGRRAVRHVHLAAGLLTSMLRQCSEQFNSLLLVSGPDDVGHRNADHWGSPVSQGNAGQDSIQVLTRGLRRGQGAGAAGVAAIIPMFDSSALHEINRMSPSNDRSQSLSVCSTDEIRLAFPALDRRHGGYPVAYFDGPGGTQVPRVVVEAMADYLIHHNANTHWAFPSSAETDHALADARRTIADFLGASSDEVVFGPNMTSLTFRLSWALGRAMEPGDAVVVTELDHHANIDPWRTLKRDYGVTILQSRMIPETGQLDWEDFYRCLNHHRIRLLAIGAASNALGTINDISRAVAMAHEAAAIAFVDAVHLAPHQLIDVRALGCDFLACSAYKFYGPHVGVLYGRRDRLESLDISKLRPAPNSLPERLELGTQNHEGIVGASAAVEFLSSLARSNSSPETNSAGLATRRQRLEAVFESLHERGAGLLERLWDGLRNERGVRLFGPPPSAPRTPTLSLTIEGVPSVEACRRLASLGIFASHGNFYAQTVTERLGVAEEGLVRLGCACYTTEEDVDRAIEGVRSIARGQL
jgi:cysteine desulfurase family protein (TIGR01976 family)